MPNFIDLTGQKFGRWTVLKRGPTAASGQTRWHCLCFCGNERLVQAGSLKRDDGFGSCGCAKLEILIARSTKHGHATNGISPTYHSWAGMKARCLDPLHKHYQHYGKRGITICHQWHKFENFLVDMGEKPPGKSIDRIDNDGPYSPENCRWATPKEQARNRRNNRLLHLNGEAKTAPEWAETLSIPVATIRDRLENGKTDAQALSTIKLSSKLLGGRHSQS
jgi:hypothetical protein